MDAPQSVAVQADAGALSTEIAWEPTSFSGGCGGKVQLACSGTHSSGISIDHLVDRGGLFPVGLSSFECVAADLTCGADVTSTWTVLVRELNRVEIDVRLSPTMASGPFERCVAFEFFTGCVEESVVITRTPTFGNPFNLPGYTRGVELMIPAGQYGCVTAWDPMHTLRSTAQIEVSGSIYRARFEGDPLFGGNWLPGGNLNGDHAIDVIDHAIWYTQVGTVQDPATPCASATRDADINGDGVVDSLDRVLMGQNWLRVEAAPCCSDGIPLADPITAISVRDLERMGLGDLSGADLNRDGIVDLVDVELYYQGYTLKRPKAVRLRASP
jgi:hypothetical protein